TVPLLGIYGTLSPLPTGLRAWGALLSIVMATLVLGWYLWLRIRRPATVQQPARHTLVRD
ncbi:MAG TPA: hypothetical protein VHF91_09745, partial [Acidimicrobiales bacterium]|nr:hypothetical protein [Acidimicrobiales bacterium]